MADASLPDRRARSRPGTAIAAMMPMMATTISSSIRVNPSCLRILFTDISFGKPANFPRDSSAERQGGCHAPCKSLSEQVTETRSLVDGVFLHDKSRDKKCQPRGDRNCLGDEGCHTTSSAAPCWGV